MTGFHLTAGKKIRPQPVMFRLILLFLTAMFAIGCGGGGSSGSANPPSPAPTPTNEPPWFEEIAESSGIDFRHENGYLDQYLSPENFGGGIALIDIENDGDLDLYFVQSGSLHQDSPQNPPNRLYRNDGDGHFTDITEASGTGDRSYGMGVATGDYDNDGDTDLYITNFGPNVLYRNNGDGTFTDVTDLSNTGDEKWSVGAAFFDYDSDGDLDLFISNYLYWTPEFERVCLNAFGRRDYCQPQSYEAPALDTLYRNNGDGTFTDVSRPAGIQEDSGNGLGVVCGDFNDDGHVDIYVANDGMKNILWINQGDGTFINRALIAGCAVDQDGHAKAGMGVTAADIDDDGDLDLLVVNLVNEADSFYRNQGTYFTEEAGKLGLNTITRPFTRFGVAFVDFDNDGRIDIYESNGRVGRQTGPFLPGGAPYAEPNVLMTMGNDGRFEEVTPRGGTAELLVDSSRGAAFGDLDNDGGMDVIVTNLNNRPYLLRNVVPSRGHWVGLRILERTGAAAIGARVRFSAGPRIKPRVITRDVRTGYSYVAANDPRIHVGLGKATVISNLTVRWSDGQTESFVGEYPADTYHTLRRGEGRDIPSQ
ncbi:MAG: CRTAC1 family protein [Planctomycetes bacterium]|nr:CRTAC1 family protein [Planctomycetota bacterium]